MSEMHKLQRPSIRVSGKELRTNTNDSETLMNQYRLLPDMAPRPIWASMSEFLRARDGFRAPCAGVRDTVHCKDSAHGCDLLEVCSMSVPSEPLAIYLAAYVLAEYTDDDSGFGG